MSYLIWGSLALLSASLGAILWYRSSRVHYAFVFLGLSLFAVPALVGCTVRLALIAGGLLLTGPVLYSVLRRRSTSATFEQRPRLSPSPFLLALASLLIGGLAFLIGLGASFRRAGNWANDLLESGIVLFFLAALSNITAFEAGCISLIRDKLLPYWLPFSFVGLLATIYFAWVAVHL